MEDEGVPYEVEGDGRPEDVAADEEIVRRERVGDDVGQRKDGVEDEEETYLKVVLQEVQDPRHNRGLITSAHPTALSSSVLPTASPGGRGSFLIRASRARNHYQALCCTFLRCWRSVYGNVTIFGQKIKSVSIHNDKIILRLYIATRSHKHSNITN